MDSVAELLARIRLGEDSTLELKRVGFTGRRVTDPRRDDLADEIAAFANGRGGTLVLGVDDKTHDILGIPLDRLDLVESYVSEICSDSVKPPVEVVIRKLEVPDAAGQPAAIVRIDVERSLFVHESPGGYYRRHGSFAKKMTQDVLLRLAQERSQSRVLRFDESPVPKTSPAELDQTMLARFLGEEPAGELALRKLRLVANDEDGEPRATVAGILLASPEPQRWLPHAMIQAVAYAGDRTDQNYQNDARDILGPIDSQVWDALHFVRRNARVAAAKELGRTEVPQYPARAVFEALVNAVAHRDYSMGGARIRLHMFADRLELYVPGALANTLTPDSLHLRQYSRNELVVSLLVRCPVPKEHGVGRSHMMDRRGDGVPIILRETRELAGRAAEYSVIDESELRLVMWAARADGGAGGGDEEPA